MGTLLIFIWLGSIVGIWYFWRKKLDKRFLLTSIAIFLLSSFLYSLTPDYKESIKKQETESSSKTSSQSVSKKEARESASKKSASESISRIESSKKQQSIAEKASTTSKKKNEEKISSATKTVKKASSSNSSSSTNKVSDSELLKRAKKLKYGMSYDEVKKIMNAKPTTDERDESGYYTLQYNVSTVILGFDEKNKLNQSIEGAPQIAKQAQAAAKKAKEESSNNRNTIAGFAQSFGQKPVEKLQRMSMVYTSERIGDNMYYIWDTGNKTVGKLVRVDDPQRFTTVYQYDENGQDGLLGKQLYSGRTIMNNPQKVYIYQ